MEDYARLRIDTPVWIKVDELTDSTYRAAMELGLLELHKQGKLKIDAFKEEKSTFGRITKQL